MNRLLADDSHDVSSFISTLKMNNNDLSLSFNEIYLSSAVVVDMHFKG